MASGQSKKRNKSSKNQDTPKMPKEKNVSFGKTRRSGVTQAHRVSGDEAFGTQAKRSYDAHGGTMSPSKKSRVAKDGPKSPKMPSVGKAADTRGIKNIGK